MSLALALLISLASGFALVSAVWPYGMPSAAAFGMKFSLSFGVGVGIFSVVYFLCRVLSIGNLYVADLLVLVLLAVLHIVLRRGSQATALPSGADNSLPRWLHNTTLTAFIIAFCAAVYNAVVRALAYPQGEGWDAFAIWNLHARFLFRGGANWRDGFSALIPWSHPDYPLLLPASIAHFWSYAGHETGAVPVMLGLLFTFGTVGLLFSALAITRGQQIAMLGTLALLATPFFVEQGMSQYADVPLAFWFLATTALLSMSDASAQNASAPSSFLILAGLSAGFAAWTKNEGVLFLLAMLLARLTALMLPWHKGDDPDSRASGEDRGWKGLSILVLSIAPALLLLGWFKHSIAPPGDLLNSNRLVSKLLTPSRYWAICKWYGRELFRFGHWLMIPGTVLLAGLWIFTGDKPRSATTAGFRASCLTLAITALGYFAIYVITPYDIYWHLRFSLNRLFLQLWPSTIFLVFLKIWVATPSSQKTAKA